ncbi:MAG: protoporphyrinogen oxidase [Planctomycetaceae bacterium]
MNATGHSNPDSTRRIAIVGGGLSGLSAAHHVLELSSANQVPVELTLFESSERLGGVIGTERIGEYLVELGADSFITNKPWAVNLCQRLNLEGELISTDETYRRSLVLRNGKPVPVPEGFMLMAPAKIWPVITSPIFSLMGKIRMGCEYFIPRRKDSSDESLAAFVRRRFGREVLDRLVQPLVGGIYTSDPEKLSLQATLPRFPEMERQYRSLIRAARKPPKAVRETESSGSGARYGLFATLRNGVGDLFEALISRIEKQATLQRNTAITNIAPVPLSKPSDKPRWQVRTNKGTTSDFDAVILTNRAYQTAELLENFDSQLASLLREIEYASSAIVVSGHSLSDISHPLDAFGLVIPAIEKRDILAVSFGSRKFPGRAPKGRVLLRTFVGGAMQPEMMDKTDDELIGIVNAELNSLLGVTGKPDFMRVARYNHAMPQYHVGHLERVAQIESGLQKHSGLEIAGNAYRGVGIPDCIHSGENAASRVMNSQNRSE